MAPDLEGRRALLVDDNDINRQILSRQLESWGMASASTESPAIALQWLAAGEVFDVAVLDMQMPEMDGVALARAILERGSEPTMPMVLLTSLVHARVPSDLFSATLTKPAKPSALHNALARAVTGHAMPGDAGRAATERAVVRDLRILLAEDNKVNQRVGALLLERLGLRADIVGNGQEAVDAMDRVPYDLILMDVRMPEMDGMEAARRIRGRTDLRQPRIVAMTASVFAEDREACRSAGMDDYLAKPVRRDELVAALERAGAFPDGAPSIDGSPLPPGGAADLDVGDAEPVDLSVLATLLQSLGERAPTVEGRLIDTFLHELPRLLSQLRVGLEAGDPESFHRAAHTLKSSSANMGALRTSRLCSDLEDRSRDSIPAEADASITEIATECVRVTEVLSARRRQLPA